jgi:2'-5' RNA ligase
MRFFSAVAVPEDIKKKVTEITRGRLPVPYVNTTNLHVTLNFFGELDTDAENLLKEIFSQAVDGFKRFEIKFDKLVKFHSQLHLTIKPNKALNDLQKFMAEFFIGRGFSLRDDREFYPHVKLANLHMDNVMNKQRKMDNFPNSELAALDFTAERVLLYESKLLLHHPKHTSVIEVPLV